jgi:hypothetical protein
LSDSENRGGANSMHWLPGFRCAQAGLLAEIFVCRGLACSGRPRPISRLVENPKPQTRKTARCGFGMLDCQ